MDYLDLDYVAKLIRNPQTAKLQTDNDKKNILHHLLRPFTLCLVLYIKNESLTEHEMSES